MTVWLFSIAFFYHENDHVSKAMAYSLWEKFSKNEKDENPSPEGQALPIRQPRFPTAGHILVSKNRALYSLLCSGGLGNAASLHFILSRCETSLGWERGSVGRVHALKA